MEMQDQVTRLNTAVRTLGNAITTEAAQINSQIGSLREQIARGTNGEQLEATIAAIEDATARIQNIVPDTIAEADATATATRADATGDDASTPAPTTSDAPAVDAVAAEQSEPAVEPELAAT